MALLVVVFLRQLVLARKDIYLIMIARCFCVHRDEAELQELYLDFNNVNHEPSMQTNAQEYSNIGMVTAKESSAVICTGRGSKEKLISSKCMAPLSPHKKCQRKCNSTSSSNKSKSSSPPPSSTAESYCDSNRNR